MSNPIPRSHGHVQPAIGPRGPGLLAFFGYVGYIVYQVIELRGIEKRESEIHKEVMRRERRLYEGHKEVSRLISEVKTKLQD